CRSIVCCTMSDDNHAGTPPQGDNGSPWARGDSSWQPASYRDTPGRDPRVPFGHPPAGAAAPEPHIEEFTPPRQSRTRPALLIAGVVGVVALLLLALQFLGSPDGAPAASPSATPGQATGDQTAAPVPAAT